MPKRIIAQYIWGRVLVYGSGDPGRGEKWAAGIILLAIFALTVWGDPC